MGTVQPQYNGKRAWKAPLEFPPELEKKLSAIYREAPGVDVTEEKVRDFTNAVLAAARFALSELHALELALNKAELIEEHDDLLRGLKTIIEMETKLRSLSPDFDVLLGPAADPLGCADRIKDCQPAVRELMEHTKRARERISTMAAAPNSVHTKSKITTELAVRVLYVLKTYGIAAAVTAKTYLRVVDITEPGSADQFESRYVSTAVRVLQCVGDCLGLHLSQDTWRDKVRGAKKQSSGLG